MDPELHMSLPDAGMIKTVEVIDDVAVIQVSLTTKGCPLKLVMEKNIKEEVGKIEGINEVKVAFGEMSDEEKQNLKNRLNTPQLPDEVLKGIKVVAIGSGKGGVGKSTVTANLALSLRDLGYKVGVMDADIFGFSIPRLLGVAGIRATAKDENTILPIEKNGLKIVSIGSFVDDEDSPIIWRGPVLMGVLQQFICGVEWGDLDYLLIDLPPGTGDVPLTIMQRIPHAYFALVTTPQASASHVAGRVAYMAGECNITNIGVIENMSYYICEQCGARHNIFGEGETEALAASLNVPVLGKLPLRQIVREKSDNGESAIEANAEVAAEFRSVAEAIVRQTVK